GEYGWVEYVEERPCSSASGMVKGPYSHGKTKAEVAGELRVYLVRINRRRSRFRCAEQRYLQEVRRHVVEAVTSGINVEEAAAAAGYTPKTVARWVAKRRVEVRGLPVERAQERLVRIGERRRRMSLTELKISARARSSVRRAMEVGLSAREFADITGYTAKTVDRWFESALQALEQAAQQREVAQARRGKRRRPPQHLSLAERAEWLAQRERRRTAVRRSYLRPRQPRTRRTTSSPATRRKRCRRGCPACPRGLTRPNARDGGRGVHTSGATPGATLGAPA
ncbi:helix-turn-helix domain-containing protein, partial [Streptomyces cyaneofuscatus]